MTIPYQSINFHQNKEMEGQSNKSNGLLSSLSCNIGWGLTVLLSNISHQHLIYGCKSHTTHKRKREKTNLGGIDRFQVHFCGKQLICTQLVMQQNVICRSTNFHTDHLSFPYSWGPSSGINAPLGDFATSGPHKLVTKSRPTVLCLLV